MEDVENLLRNSGLSCDDLLSKLLDYKKHKENTSNTSSDETPIKNDLTEENSTETTSENIDLHTQATPDNCNKDGTSNKGIVILENIQLNNIDDEEFDTLKEFENSTPNNNESLECNPTNESAEINPIKDKFTVIKEPLDFTESTMNTSNSEQDVLRQSLLNQLSSLRNNKRKLPDDSINTSKTMLLNENTCKKHKIDNVIVIDDDDQNKLVSNLDTMDEELDDIVLPDKDLVVMDKETDFVITNVVGGADFIDYLDEETNTIKDKPETTLSNNDNDNASIEKLSNVFVSDKLENFFNTDTALNISYQIPTLQAEEGVTPPENEIIKKQDPDSHSVSIRDGKIVEPKKPFKARTLAEFRQQLESRMADRNWNHRKGIKLKLTKKKNKKNTGDPALISEMSTTQEINSKNKENLQSPTENINRTSYVVCDNKKISVPTYLTNQKLTEIGETSNNENEQEPDQSSALDLVAKPEDQSTEQVPPDNAIYQIQFCQLPIIYFEVRPEITKSIPEKYQHLLTFFQDLNVSKKRTKFALTMVKTKNDTESTNTEMFKFPITYQNNQETAMLKSHKLTNRNYYVGLEVEVTRVLNKIIDFVDLKVNESDYVNVKYDDSSLCENSYQISEDSNKPRLSEIILGLSQFDYKEFENKNNATENCNQLFCRLGCVCRSINCEVKAKEHCGLIKCMFECVCKKKYSKKKLQHDSKKFAIIEEKVEKNLAKNEQDFTRTDMNAMDIWEPIKRQRHVRKLKAPKKYEDYVSTERDILISTMLHTNFKDTNKKENDKLKKNTEKETTKESQVSLNLKDRYSEVTKPCFVNLIKYDFKDIVPFCMEHCVLNCGCEKESLVSDRIQSSKVLAQEQIKLVDNKKSSHKKKVSNQKIPQTQKPTSSNDTELKKVRETKIKTKRKQSFDKIREDNDSMILEISPELEKSDSENKHSSVIEFNDSLSDTKEIELQNDSYKPIFEGEIRINLDENPEFTNMIMDKSQKLENLRLVPLTTLVKGYHDKSIIIFSKISKPSFIICNLADKFDSEPEGFRNIESINSSSSKIIQWIHSSAGPNNEPINSIHVVMKPFEDHYLLSGFCKKQNDVDKKNENTEEFIECFCTWNRIKLKFAKIRLINLESEENPKLEPMQISLPRNIKQRKWLVVLMQSNFAYLNFNDPNYYIKYKTLQNTLRTAKELKYTHILRIKKFSDSYKCKDFGLYCTPEFDDRVFIGPFNLCDTTNIDTLRFKDGTLISTEEYDRIHKLNVDETKFWMVEEDLELKVNAFSVEIMVEQSGHLLSSPFMQEMKSDGNLLHNKYFFTNIPTLGYLKVREELDRFIVFKPGIDNVIYNFYNRYQAKDVMVQYFNHIFICNLPSFKINIRISNNCKTQKQEVDEKYFSDKLKPYLFNAYGISQISKDFCMAREDFKEYYNMSLKRMVNIFGTFLGYNNRKKLELNPIDDIFIKASDELKKLQKESEEYIEEVNRLQGEIEAKKAILRNVQPKIV